MGHMLWQGDDNDALTADGEVKAIDLNEVLHVNAPYSFVFRMGSDSFKDEGIFKGDFVVIRRDIIAEPGQIVAVKVGGKFSLRKFAYYEESKTKHQQGHSEYVRYHYNGTPDFEIFGVVSSVFRKTLHKHRLARSKNTVAPQKQ